MHQAGKDDAVIDSIFAKYDLDGDRVLDEVEQDLMAKDLKVPFRSSCVSNQYWPE